MTKQRCLVMRARQGLGRSRLSPEEHLLRSPTAPMLSRSIALLCVAPIVSIATVKAMRRPDFKTVEALADRLVGGKGKQVPDTRKEVVRITGTNHTHFA